MNLDVLKDVAFVFFFAAFLSLVLWLALTDRDRFSRQARLPLHEDEPGNRQP
jgi:hypothetical protein